MRTGGFNPDRRSYPQIAHNVSVGGLSTVAHVYAKETNIESPRSFTMIYYVGGGELIGGTAYEIHLQETVANK